MDPLFNNKKETTIKKEFFFSFLHGKNNISILIRKKRYICIYILKTADSLCSSSFPTFSTLLRHWRHVVIVAGPALALLGEIDRLQSIQWTYDVRIFVSGDSSFCKPNDVNRRINSIDNFRSQCLVSNSWIVIGEEQNFL